MGPVAIAAPLVIGGAIIANQRDDDHVEVDHHTGSHNIGGQLTNVVRTNQLRENKTMDVNSLDNYLITNGVPEDKIREAQKIKMAIQDTVQSIQFYVTDSQFIGKVIVVKGKKLGNGQVQILLCKQMLQAKYTAPQIQSNFSRSGARYSARGLDANETAALTNSLKGQVTIVQNQLKAITI